MCLACGQPLLVGDRYRCQAVLGQGGFGRTYGATVEASDPGNALPQPCVVKQILARGQDPNRFRQEVDRLATLGQHPQIPTLLDQIDGPQGQFLVQAYIPGPNLDQYLAHQSEINRETLAQRVLYELLPVLAYIHRQGVIHRDIKPANIIVPPAPALLVLVDFGAAKALIDPDQLKQTATVIGSAGYAAPEQALGKAVFASDLFSLGVTCLHLLTGLHPFDLYSIGDDAWVWRPYIGKAVSPALGRVLDRLVNRRLAERYSTAQEVLADLRWSGLAMGGNAKASLQAPSRASIQTSGAPTTWQQRYALSLPGVVATAVAMAPSGRAIAAACSDGAVRLWDCTTGEPLHTWRRTLGWLGPGHRGSVNAVAFTPTGETVISGGEDGQLICWDRATGSAQVLPVAAWQISALLVSADRTLAVGSGDGRIYLWPLGGGAAPKPLVQHQDGVTALAVDEPGKLLVSGGRDRTLRLWALPSGRLIRTLTAPTAALTALACHPQDGRIVSGDNSGQVQVWSADQLDGLVIHRARGAIMALAMSPNGDWLAIGAEDGSLTLINLQGAGPSPPQHHGWAVQALAFTPDSRLLVSTSADETIRFWCL
jgi:hypothetical protein